MSPPKQTVWPLEPPTQGKHLVLRSYLNAWIPILATWNKRLLFIDGFAGPGEYEDGEDGSPVIALKALIEHTAKISSEIVFLFMDNDKNRTEHLDQVLDNLSPKPPPNAKIQIIQGKFDDTMDQVLEQIEEQKKQLAPCFVMIDPFGISDTPMSIIKRIVSNPRSEIYVTFMYEFFNRFKKTTEFEKHLDELFGCENWREGIDIQDYEKRKNFFFDLYKGQLKKAGCKYVVSFDLYKGKRHVYSIFFGTQHLKGCDVMKSAIWSIAPLGDFRFEGTQSAQLTLNINNPDFKPLKEALKKRFCNKDWIRIEIIMEFVASDETDYCTGQVKSILREMELSNEIEVDESSRRKKRTYPDGTKIRF